MKSDLTGRFFLVFDALCVAQKQKSEHKARF
jgi:hypothetical protein